VILFDDEDQALLERELADQPTESGVNFCDITKVFPVDKKLNTKVDNPVIKAELTIYLKPNGFFSIDKFIHNGVDKTANVPEPHNVSATPSSHGRNCRTSDYYLSWQLGGKAVEYILKECGFATATTYAWARKDGPRDGNLWLVANYVLWAWQQLTVL
jgi:hypothetical protein